MEEGEEISDVHVPQQTESIMEEENLSSPTQCEAAVAEIEDSQLVATLDGAGVDEEAAPTADIETAEPGIEMTETAVETTETAVETTEMEVFESSKGSGKRKRGRPPRVQSKPPARTQRKKEEEEVCFICFDGGNLVLCDRRFCPKAYHPVCVNRDEAFFQSRGRWNCGWHICSDCEKAANYMCYTCTYSLCKGCIKEAGFLCVRGNKGFCETCMRTVMMIEKAEHGNKEMAQVDFDDKNSWEYLFKDYWLDLKGKLSLTLDELTGARNPWKGSGVLALNEGSSDELYDANDDPGSGSDSSSGHREGNNSKRKKAKRRPKSIAIEEQSSSAVKAVGNEGASVPDDAEWASKELLEFVEHMKDGDKSVLSQFDVQALLLEYIKRNNLRDPRRKSQIICDSRLQNLFGKARVGHFEMLKLLESHFLIKEASAQVFTDDIQRGAADTDALQIDAEGSVDTVVRMGSDKKRKTRKKIEERVPQINLDDYAAIDLHNINLIYLRRNLMEDLIQDIDKFQDKVVGSFVRIRISGTGQKQDMYRLVQVVGTGKAADTYKTGKTTTDIMLEILNLNKTEIISIDTISNQEFSEEECKRLRQSIKCGFISRLTVGEVQEKARALQAVRVTDWLETEIMRLSHLRDRASEKGRRKELRECVEKLQLLSTPEERSRRLHELPEVHSDPNMDPSYESDDDEGQLDDSKKDNHMRPRDAGFARKGKDLISPGKGGSASFGSWDGARKNSSTSWDKGDASISPGKRTNETSWIQGKDAHQPNSWETPKNQATTTGLDNDSWSSQPVSTGAAMSSKISETEKIWHYQDPSGKIQGPFSMTQLRKWSTTGYFPADLRIWKTSEKQEDSIALTDALIGKFHNDGSWKDASGHANGNFELTKTDGWGTQSPAWAAPAAEVVNPKEGWAGSSSQGWDSSKVTSTWSGQSQGLTHETNWNQHRGREGRGGGNSGRWNSGQNRESNLSTNRPTGVQSSGHGYERRSNNWGSSGQSSGEGWKVQPDYNSSKEWAMASGVETPKIIRDGWGANPGGRNDFPNLPTPTTPTPQPSGGFSGSQGTEEWSPTSTVSVQPSSTGWGAMGTQSDRIATGWGDQPPTSPTPSAGGLTSNLPSASMLKPTEVAVGWDASQASSKLLTDGLSTDPGGASDFSNLPSPTPKPNSGGGTLTQGAESRWAATTTVSVPPTISGWGTAPNPGGDGAQKSPIVVNEAIQIATDWNKQPPALLLPSVGGWDSGSVPNSMPMATETVDGRNAAQILKINELIHSAASLPAPPKPIEREDGWGSHASEAPKSTLSESKASSSLPNQSVPELSWKDDRAVGNMETLLCAVGHTTSEPKNGCDTTQISDIVDATPKAGVLASDCLSSESNQNVSSQLTVAGGEPLVLHNDAVDPERKTSEARAPTVVESAVTVDVWGSNTSRGPEVDWRASADISATSPAQKGIVSDVQGLVGNVPKPPVSHGWGPDGTVKKLEVTGSSPRPGFESHGWGEPATAQKQEPANLTPKPELVSGGWGPSPSASNNMAGQTGNSMGPPNLNRNNWTMSPTAQIPRPSGWDVGNNQNSMSAMSNNRNPTPGNNPWTTDPATEAPTPSNTHWSTENPKMVWGMTPENSSTGWGMAAQGNTNTGWGTPAQGITNNSSGTVAHGNTNMVWDASGGNSNAWGNPQKHSEEKFSGHGGRGFQGSDSGGHGGGRPSWNRTSSFGGSGGGGSSRPPSRGPRVCKFHENGHCKKGASCGYLHT